MKLNHPNYNLPLQILLVLLLVSLSISLIPKLGMNEDAIQLHEYGNQVLDYYLSGFKQEPRILTNPKDINELLERYYGTLFELPAAALHRFIFTKSDPYLIRHSLNVFFFLLGILFLAALSRDLGGNIQLSILLFFVLTSPRFIAHGVVNPKDIPFFSMYAFCLWAYARIWKRLPEASWKDWLIMALATGSLIGVRLGGIIWIAYMWLFTGIKLLLIKRSYWQVLLKLIVTSIAGYLFGLLWIPFVLQSPIERTIEGIRILSQFPITISVIFEGKTLPSTYRPWYYPLKWMLITIPPGIIAGWIIGTSLWLIKGIRSRLKAWIADSRLSLITITLFVGIFPIFYVIYRESNLYDGWRHLLFTYGPALIVASWGFATLISHLIQAIKITPIRLTIPLLLPVIAQADAIRWTLVNYPYLSVYFNPLAGGIKGAYGNYELDYYQTSVKAACKKLITLYKKGKLPKSDTLIIATNTAKTVIHHLKELIDSQPVRVRYVRYYQRSQQAWHVAVWYTRFVDPQLLKKGWFPPYQVIHSEDADDKALSVIQLRPSLDDYKAHIAITRNELEKAESLLTAYLSIDPRNELALEMLATVLIKRNKPDKALQLLEKATRELPSYPPLIILKARVFLLLGKPLRASMILNKLLRERPYQPQAYLLLAEIYANQGKFTQALNVAYRAATIWNNIPVFYQVIGEIYQAMGNQNMAQRYFNIARSLSSR